MADVKPKFKFKKRSKASIKKKQLRNSKVEDDNTTNDNVVKKQSKADVENINTTTAIGDNKEEDDEPSALTAIMTVERRRKLLGNRNRGVDTANLGKNTIKHTTLNNETIADDTIQNNNKDLDERLNKSFAGGKLAGSNDMGGDDEDGILAKKHRLAMETYIKDNLNETKDGKGEEKERNNNNNNNTTTDAEKQMYAELLIPETTTTQSGNTPIKGSEGDVGAGGAMMGGTGIAEVALPIDERIKAMRETERVAMEYERARKARYGEGADGDGIPEVNEKQPPATTTASDLTAMVPMNFASGPGKRKRQDEVGLIGIEDHSSSTSQTKQKTTFIGPGYNNAGSSAIPAGSLIGLSVEKSDVDTLGASYSHNFQLHTKEWISRKRDERQLEIDEAEAQQAIDEGLTTTNDGTDTRVGFEMSRKIARGEVNLTASAAAASRARNKNEWDNKGRLHQSSDERAFRQFMSKSRNRR